MKVMHRVGTDGRAFCGRIVEVNGTGRPCKSCERVADTQNARPEASATGDAVTDLFERARSLGYTDGAAMNVADVFVNWHNVSDPCETHPAMSTTMHNGYAVDMCESCKVIELSTEAGWTMAGWVQEQAERHGAYISLMHRELAEGQAAGNCVCWIITEMGRDHIPTGGIACNGCGSVFTPAGAEPSPEVAYASAAAVLRCAETDPETSAKLCNVRAYTDLSDPIQDDAGTPALPDAPCTRAYLEHAATMASDAMYAAAHDATLMAMCRGYVANTAIHRTPVGNGYTNAIIAYAEIRFPDLSAEDAALVVCEALADACADRS